MLPLNVEVSSRNETTIAGVDLDDTSALGNGRFSAMTMGPPRGR